MRSRKDDLPYLKDNESQPTTAFPVLSSILVAVTVVIIIFLITWWLSLLKYSGLRNVPGPTPLPIIGNANEVGKTTVDLLHSLLKLQKRYGSFYKLWLGPRLHLMVSKPEYLEHLLNSNIHLAKSDGYDLFKPWLGDGLLVSTGVKWKIRRKMITPTFHFKILEEFMFVFNKQFDILLDILTKEVEKNPGKSTDITKFMSLASLDIICETAFGTPIQAQFKGNEKYVEAVTGYLEIFTLRFFSSSLRNPLVFRLSHHYKKYKEYLKILHDFTNKIIKERKAEYRNKKEFSQKAADDGIKRKAALLDMLLQATSNGEQLSDEDIREEVDTFMFEGHDTSNTAICYTLYALCHNPNVQKKVYEEVLETFGTNGTSEITLAQINELKYLDIVIKEAIRYYPPVPLIERMLEDDWTIDGITIPKGTNISIFLYGMNHNPDTFPDPERFDPERFLPEKQTSRHLYSFIPFSAGPRNCIGQKFALNEMKTCIAKFIQRFELLPDPDFKEQTGMCSVLKSKNGLKMILKDRHT